jgi:hypothetical protein
MMLFGALLVLIGLTVVLGKGPQGWVEVIFGLLLIVTPVLLTANKRRLIREQESRSREEHEERETRNRALIGAYGEALEQLLANPNDETLDRMRCGGTQAAEPCCSSVSTRSRASGPAAAKRSARSWTAPATWRA